MNLVILIAFALAPGLAIALFIYLKDIHEPEPMRPLIVGFICGIISFFLGLGIAYFLDDYLTLNETDLVHQGIKALLVVSLAEELSKFAFLRGVMYPNRNFDEPFDGIVYSVMIGMGFATTENILYVINGDTGTAMIRMITAVPAHATFAVIMGYFVGEAKMRPGRSWLLSFFGLISAIAIHGAYDYFLFISFIPGIWIGAAVSLLIAYILSHHAIKRHQDQSPFKFEN